MKTKRRFPIPALLLALTSPGAFAQEDLFVCIAVGFNVSFNRNVSLTGVGPSETAAREAALNACRQSRSVGCQIAHCGRTVPETPNTELFPED